MSSKSAKPAPPVAPVRPFAVIDVGTSAIRMALADLPPGGGVKHLETLSQPTDIGRDTFTRGAIARATIEQCVDILRRYRKVMAEHDITEPSSFRAVATSAVREATNRDAFLDRLYMATGIQVDLIDDAETTRLTYMSVLPHFEKERGLKNARTLVAEVGGGNTELLVMRGTNLLHSRLQRLGSLRLHELAETSRFPGRNAAERLDPHVRRAIEDLKPALDPLRCETMLALGGDARFAATHLLGEWDQERPARLSVKALAEFTHQILALSSDDLVREYHLTYADSETLGPALLILTRLAQAFRFKTLLVSGRTMRDGLLRDAAGGGVWSSDFVGLVEESVLQVGRKYQFDEPHALEVADMTDQLFAALQREHNLTAHYGTLLRAAALLHEIGGFVSSRSHHKHSYYLIRNSDIFGLGQRDLAIVALVARYHRRSPPRSTHPEYMALTREDRLVVGQLAAILRVGDALARGTRHRLRKIDCRREPDRFVVGIPGGGDIAMEQFALRQKGGLFEDVYGIPAVLEKSG